MGCSEPGWPNTKRYEPPVRASVSQDRKVIPKDSGAHHRMISSGLVHASNTMRAGPSKVRVATSSRSEVRSTVVRLFIGLLPAFQVLDDLVQGVEAFVPKPAVPLDPRRLFLEAAPAEPTGPHAPNLLRGDAPRLLQDPDVLLHAREGHVEFVGELRDRSLRTPQPLQNP